MKSLAFIYIKCGFACLILILQWGFYVFRVVYSVKEIDSHAKHGQSLKQYFGQITIDTANNGEFP